MVITTSGKKCCLQAVALREFETQRIAVKRECSFQVGEQRFRLTVPA